MPCLTDVLQDVLILVSQLNQGCSTLLFLCFSYLYVSISAIFTPANIQNIFLSTKLRLSNKMKEHTKKGQRRQHRRKVVERSSKDHRRMGLKKHRGGGARWMVVVVLYSRRESNSDQRFRKPLFYPLNYGSCCYCVTDWRRCAPWAACFMSTTPRLPT